MFSFRKNDTKNVSTSANSNNQDADILKGIKERLNAMSSDNQPKNNIVDFNKTMPQFAANLEEDEDDFEDDFDNYEYDEDEKDETASAAVEQQPVVNSAVEDIDDDLDSYQYDEDEPVADQQKSYSDDVDDEEFDANDSDDLSEATDEAQSFNTQSTDEQQISQEIDEDSEDDDYNSDLQSSDTVTAEQPYNYNQSYNDTEEEQGVSQIDSHVANAINDNLSQLMEAMHSLHVSVDDMKQQQMMQSGNNAFTSGMEQFCKDFAVNWMNVNLPHIVEKVVQEQIAKLMSNK
jgi:AP-4 complex subunit epsilon-1